MNQDHSGFECDTAAATVEQFAARLLRLAKSRLPLRLQSRVDEEDIVQSAFRSFFRRHEDGQFSFHEEDDVWRLLATITYRKVQRTIRFHNQDRRDISREATPESDGPQVHGSDPSASDLAVMMELLDAIIEQLPARHQEILQLRLEGYSVDEIANRVNVSSRTVERALALVRRIATNLAESNEA